MTSKRFKISPEWRLLFLDILPKNKLQSTSIFAILYFFLKNTCSFLFCGVFASNLFMYLVTFFIIMWKQENRNFYDQPPDHRNFYFLIGSEKLLLLVGF